MPVAELFTSTRCTADGVPWLLVVEFVLVSPSSAVCLYRNNQIKACCLEEWDEVRWLSSETDVRYYSWGGVHLCMHTLNMWSYCGMIWEQTCHVEPCVHKKDNLEKPESVYTG